MSLKYATHIDLAKNELQNAVLQPLSAPPTSPVEGQIYYDTTDQTAYIRVSGQWLNLGMQGGGGTGATNLGTSYSATNVVVTSDTGTNATLNAADGSNAGVMTSAQFTKLNGVATGATANQTDAYLLNRTNHTGTQTASTISDFNASADARIANAAGSTVASLVAGKVPTSQLPAIALTEVFVVASEVAQLALIAQEGDVAVRTDLSKTYIHNGGTAGTMADWTELATPTDAVTSVNGQTGAVTLDKGDVGLGNVDNTSDANKPVSTAQATADNLRLLKTANLSDVANAATAFTNIKQAATATTTGVVELATVTEAEARTDTTRAVTPAGLATFTRKFTGTIGNGTLTSIPVTHGLATQTVTAQVFEVSSNEMVMCDVIQTSTTVTTFRFTTAPATNSLRVVIVG